MRKCASSCLCVHVFFCVFCITVNCIHAASVWGCFHWYTYWSLKHHLHLQHMEVVCVFASAIASVLECCTEVNNVLH